MFVVNTLDVVGNVSGTLLLRSYACQKTSSTSTPPSTALAELRYTPFHSLVLSCARSITKPLNKLLRTQLLSRDKDYRESEAERYESSSMSPKGGSAMEESDAQVFIMN